MRYLGEKRSNKRHTRAASASSIASDDISKTENTENMSAHPFKLPQASNIRFPETEHSPTRLQDDEGYLPLYMQTTPVPTATRGDSEVQWDVSPYSTGDNDYNEIEANITTRRKRIREPQQYENDEIFSRKSRLKDLDSQLRSMGDKITEIDRPVIAGQQKSYQRRESPLSRQRSFVSGSNDEFSPTKRRLAHRIMTSPAVPASKSFAFSEKIAMNLAPSKSLPDEQGLREVERMALSISKVKSRSVSRSTNISTTFEINPTLNITTVSNSTSFGKPLPSQSAEQVQSTHMSISQSHTDQDQKLSQLPKQVTATKPSLTRTPQVNTSQTPASRLNSQITKTSYKVTKDTPVRTLASPSTISRGNLIKDDIQKSLQVQQQIPIDSSELPVTSHPSKETRVDTAQHTPFPRTAHRVNHNTLSKPTYSNLRNSVNLTLPGTIDTKMESEASIASEKPCTTVGSSTQELFKMTDDELEAALFELDEEEALEEELAKVIVDTNIKPSTQTTFLNPKSVTESKANPHSIQHNHTSDKSVQKSRTDNKPNFGTVQLNNTDDVRNSTVTSTTANSTNHSTSSSIRDSNSNINQNRQVAASNMSSKATTRDDETQNLLNEEDSFDFDLDNSDFDLLEEIFEDEDKEMSSGKSKGSVSGKQSESMMKIQRAETIEDIKSTTANSASTKPSVEGSGSSSVVSIKRAARRTTVTETPLSINSLIRHPNLRRFAVRTLREGIFQEQARYSNKIIEKDECIVTVIDKNEQLSEIVLRGIWLQCLPRSGDIVHVILENTEDTTGSAINSSSETFAKNATIINRYVIDDNKNLFIVCPDTLVTATSVASSFECMRKVVLKDRVFLPNDPGTAPMILGTMVHIFFQKCLEENDFSENFMNEIANGLIQSYLEDILLAGSSRAQFVNDMELAKSCIQNWSTLYLSKVPKPQAFIETERGMPQMSIALSDMIEVEDRVYSPAYGLKGDIDITAQVAVVTKGSSQNHVVPIEIKTSRKNVPISHSAQTMIYTLMAADRYGLYENGVAFGILVYILQQKTIQVTSNKMHVANILVQRNKLAVAMKQEENKLPPIEASAFMCMNCEYFTSCSLISNVVEGGKNDLFPSELHIEYEKLISGLGATEREFYNKWDDLLRKEESIVEAYQKDIWTVPSQEREKKQGLCFSSLKIEKVEKVNASYLCTLTRSGLDWEFDFGSSAISMGDGVFITDDETNTMYARGILRSGTSDRITISTTRDLRTVLSSKLSGLNIGTSTINDTSKVISCKLRLDKEVYEASLGLARNNIIQLLSLREPHNNLKKMILHNYTPSFQKSSPEYKATSKNYHLNRDQLNAIDKVIRADDCTLILGMPGTGKTTSIAALIDTLVSLGKTVLLSSYTHSAVDNILIKIKDNGYGILRLGHPANVHPDVRSLALSHDRVVTNLAEAEDIYMKPQVVAATCMGIRHWLFSRRRFDYCIVDEASQATLPTCIGPILQADKFVLVGDHYQLSPVVKHADALEGGLDISLFKFLNDKFPDVVVNLEHQYRMCKDIMLLSNSLVYDGKLKCGNEKVANLSLKIADKSAIESWTPPEVKNSTSDWLAWILKEENKVLFLDTDEIPEAIEQNKDDRILNYTEGDLIHTIVEALCTCGVPESSIGVLTVYRAQLRLLNSMLSSRRDVEKLTADRFQGRDKDCVVISLVRSNSANQIGELLQDWRRINVAFTRAKSKLIIIGSRKTLISADALNHFFDIMQNNNWIHKLPKNAHKAYNLPISSSLPVTLRYDLDIIVGSRRTTINRVPSNLASDFPMVGGGGYAPQSMGGLNMSTSTKLMEKFVPPTVRQNDLRKGSGLRPDSSRSSSTAATINSSGPQYQASNQQYSGAMSRNQSTHSTPHARTAARYTSNPNAQYRSAGPVTRDTMAEFGTNQNNLNSNSKTPNSIKNTNQNKKMGNRGPSNTKNTTDW